MRILTEEQFKEIFRQLLPIECSAYSMEARTIHRILDQTEKIEVKIQ